MKAKLKLISSGHGPDLVLLHGWGVNSGIWHTLVPTLELHYRLHLLDLPGFGINADIHIDKYNLPTIAAMVAEVLPKNTTLLGWSLGGLIAQYIGINQMASLNKMILLCSSPCFVAQDSGWPGIQANILSNFQSQLNQHADKTVERFLAIQAMGSPSLRQDVKSLQAAIADAPSASHQALANGLQILACADLRQDLAKSDVPTLRVYGERDTLVPNSAIEHIMRFDPQAKVTTFQRSAHAPFISQAQDFVEFLIKNKNS